MRERKEFMRKNLDFYRTALIFEPRGHKDMFGAVLVPPVSKKAVLGYCPKDRLSEEKSFINYGILGTSKHVKNIVSLNKGFY